MMDRIRIQIMELSYKRRNKCVDWETRLCQKIDAYVKNLMDSSCSIHVDDLQALIVSSSSRIGDTNPHVALRAGLVHDQMLGENGTSAADVVLPQPEVGRGWGWGGG
ncbi:hypothetical protein Taro_034607 [Colocasia esculenta]|uniref:Uncharacterized protein n=1 Tax=Colocasia esculenta TaxID=4460 RepID=A0A843VY61_COLES|nr:hypothetical protein [Colocasia esculenta]